MILYLHDTHLPAKPRERRQPTARRSAQGQAPAATVRPAPAATLMRR